MPEYLSLARGLAYALGVWPRSERPLHPEFFAERGPEFAAVCRRVFEEADRRTASLEEVPDELRQVRLRFAWMAVDGWLSCRCMIRWWASGFRT